MNVGTRSRGEARGYRSPRFRFSDRGPKPSKQLKDGDRYTDVKIDFVVLYGLFGPELIGKLSREWRIPQNFMFIGSPGDRFP